MGAVSIKELAVNSGSSCVIRKVTAWCSGLRVSALDSGQSGLRSSPGRGHCVVIIGKKTSLS